MTKKRQKKKKPNALWVNIGLFVMVTLQIILVIVLVQRGFQSPVETLRDEGAPALVGEHIQVAVLNGCGVSGLAAEMTLYLRRYGFDVVESGDYSSFDVQQSAVYDRIGNPEAARQLALALGIPEDRIFEDVNPDEYLDAAIVIGHDYAELKAFPNARAASNASQQNP